jgi:hypothetical protein
MPPQKIQYRRVALLRHLAEIAMPAALDKHEFRAGYFLRENPR